jgi:hypothetical protein
MKEIQDIAAEIAETAEDYPREVRDEVVSELIEIAAREEMLSPSGREQLEDALCDLGVI